jgi:hypothetical protein
MSTIALDIGNKLSGIPEEFSSSLNELTSSLKELTSTILVSCLYIASSCVLQGFFFGDFSSTEFRSLHLLLLIRSLNSRF